MVQAHTIALIDAGPLPLNVDIGAGPVVAGYAAVQYNGATITAAQVTPPAFLNIVPKVVNEIAQRRQAAGGGAPGAPVPEAAPIPPVQVPGAGGALADPQLPPNNILQSLLEQSKWGNALIGLVQDIRTPIRITTDSIDSIFAWEGKARTIPECNTSYAEEIADLLQLPSGIRLFRDIIVAHHCLPGLPGVKFISTNEGSSATVFRSSDPCSINLQWGQDHHVGDERIVVARSNVLGGGGAGDRLDFITAHVPPSMVLAHELGHYLDGLMACKSIMDSANHVDIVSEVIASDALGCRTSYEEEIYSTEWGVGVRYPQCKRKAVLDGILPNLPVSLSAEQAFIDLWNYRDSEWINILPVGKILNDGGSSYSDGIVMGEAYIAGNIWRPHGQFYFTKREKNGVNREVGINVGPSVVAESFVCLGHVSPQIFWEIFDSLPTADDKAAFKGLVANMLGLISVPGPGGAMQPLSVANNNLPSF
jgi:hypothetical protein